RLYPPPSTLHPPRCLDAPARRNSLTLPFRSRIKVSHAGGARLRRRGDPCGPSRGLARPDAAPTGDSTMRTRACLLGALPAALACFCLTSAIATAQKRPATPKDAIAQALTALADGDEAKALAAIDTKDNDQKEVIRSIIAFN